MTVITLDPRMAEGAWRPKMRRARRGRWAGQSPTEHEAMRNLVAFEQRYGADAWTAARALVDRIESGRYLGGQKVA